MPPPRSFRCLGEDALARRLAHTRLVHQSPTVASGSKVCVGHCQCLSVLIWSSCLQPSWHHSSSMSFPKLGKQSRVVRKRKVLCKTFSKPARISVVIPCGKLWTARLLCAPMVPILAGRFMAQGLEQLSHEYNRANL